MQALTAMMTTTGVAAKRSLALSMMVFALLLVLATAASAHSRVPPSRVPVEIAIIGPNGIELPQYATDSGDRALRSYLAAERGQRYRIRVRNRSGERLAVVVAVDGRNIISGARSELAPTEPMYILGPWESADYSGWRTDLQAVNEFYFTDWQDSYSEAFGDRSARGVIAVSAYREQPVAHPPYRAQAPSRERSAANDKAARGAPAASAPATADAMQESEATPGTGYGDRREEGAVRVRFRADPREQARVLIKYEWHATLCQRGIIDCEPANRLWNDSRLGFAPPPPRRAR
ncbi:MAG TPA: hypothetical protein P5528_14715 [Steroidobacteraceae bacterium]|nr:hypothetical protein [Steroidobacteraceae bacterium]HRX90689.1 hypothetical protein [Steroidobacteraceae bacterium]